MSETSVQGPTSPAGQQFGGGAQYQNLNHLNQDSYAPLQIQIAYVPYEGADPIVLPSQELVQSIVIERSSQIGLWQGTMTLF